MTSQKNVEGSCVGIVLLPLRGKQIDSCDLCKSFRNLEIYLASVVRNLIEIWKQDVTKKSDLFGLKLKCYCGFSRQVKYTTGPYFRRRLWSNHEGACQGDTKKPLRNSVRWRGRVRLHWYDITEISLSLALLTAAIIQISKHWPKFILQNVAHYLNRSKLHFK